MKKAVAWLLIAALSAVLLAGCGGDSPTTPPAETPPADPPTTETPSDTTPTPPVGGNEGEGDPVTPPVKDPSVPPEATMPTLPADAVNVVTDWGISTAAGAGISNGMLLYEKMTALADGATVYFPEGVYELDLPLLLTGKQHIRVVGYQATLLNTRAVNSAAAQNEATDPAIPAPLRPATATSGMVWIEGCTDIAVEGITFRYANPTSISGTVKNKTSSYADITVTSDTPITGNEYVMAINTFTSNGIPDRTLEQYAATSFPVQKIDATTLRISGINASALSVGTRVCLRTSLSSNYIFTIFNSSDLAFRDLALANSFNGGFLIEHRTVNATFERVRVQSPDKNALMSLNADALHLTGLGGELVIRDCYFERAGDDFLNISGAAGKIQSLSGNTLSVALSWGADSRWATTGDTIEFYDRTTLALLGSAVVTRVDGSSLTFDSLPTGVTASTLLSNKTLHPKTLVENSYFRYNRARGLLLQTDDVTVRNCHFYGTALAAILAAPDLANWYEVSPVRGLTITGCTFDACGASASGVIQLSTNHDKANTPAAAPIHADITISGCTFLTTKTALYAVSCRNLTFTNNATRGSVVAILLSCNGVAYDAAIADGVHTQSTTDITTLPAE